MFKILNESRSVAGLSCHVYILQFIRSPKASVLLLSVPDRFVICKCTVKMASNVQCSVKVKVKILILPGSQTAKLLPYSGSQQCITNQRLDNESWNYCAFHWTFLYGWNNVFSPFHLCLCLELMTRKCQFRLWGAICMGTIKWF